MIKTDQIYNEDCLEGMKRIPDNSVDCIICDLPYGTTGLKWDCPIPADKLWEQYRRIIKPDGAIVLFCQQPFTTVLIASNIEMWKYNWIWEKEMGTNFINCNYCPLKVSEDIAVFSKAPIAWVKSGERMKYNPQMSKGKPYVCTNGNSTDKAYSILHSQSQVCGHVTVNNGERYPTNILRFIRDRDKLHPTQKPVALIEYLIKTYSNRGELILDNCMGSGTTAIACIRTHRNYIGFELDKGYYDKAQERIRLELAAPRLDFGEP